MRTSCLPIIYLHLLWHSHSQWQDIWFEDGTTTTKSEWTESQWVYWDYDDKNYDDACATDRCVMLWGGEGTDQWISRSTDISIYMTLRLKYDVTAHSFETSDACEISYAYDTETAKTLSEKIEPTDPSSSVAHYYTDQYCTFPSAIGHHTIWIWLETFEGSSNTDGKDLCFWDNIYLQGVLAPTLPPTAATPNPTVSPTNVPTVPPTKFPTVPPTKFPTLSPSTFPTLSPTKSPTTATNNPTLAPTKFPTVPPSKFPTVPPTLVPTPSPTVDPTVSPTKFPTVPPTLPPTKKPTPATSSPSKSPTKPPTMDYGDIWFEDGTTATKSQWTDSQWVYWNYDGTNYNDACVTGRCVLLWGGEGSDQWTFRQTDITYYDYLQLKYDVTAQHFEASDACEISYAYDVKTAKTLGTKIQPMNPLSSPAHYYRDQYFTFPSAAGHHTIWIWLEILAGSTNDGQDLCFWDNIHLQGVFGPTIAPTKRTPNPSPQPTAPTLHPSRKPTKKPTPKPTKRPTKKPTRKPSKHPTPSPTRKPTTSPITVHPTDNPTNKPSKQPTPSPIHAPTASPITANPTNAPIDVPTTSPTNPTRIPSRVPSNMPSKVPSEFPSVHPTIAYPTVSQITANPTNTPTTANPTNTPTNIPTIVPTNIPSKNPSKTPTDRPTNHGSPTAPSPTLHLYVDDATTSYANTVDKVVVDRGNSIVVKQELDNLAIVLIVLCSGLCLILLIVLVIGARKHIFQNIANEMVHNLSTKETHSGMDDSVHVGARKNTISEKDPDNVVHIAKKRPTLSMDIAPGEEAIAMDKRAKKDVELMEVIDDDSTSTDNSLFDDHQETRGVLGVGSMQNAIRFMNNEERPHAEFQFKAYEGAHVQQPLTVITGEDDHESESSFASLNEDRTDQNVAPNADEPAIADNELERMKKLLAQKDAQIAAMQKKLRSDSVNENVDNTGDDSEFQD